MSPNKRSLDYLSVSYSTKSKPVTSYPLDLITYLTSRLGISRGSVIDVGCGRGDQLLAFQKLGFQICGLDIEDSCRDIDNHHICDISIDPFPFPDNSFDIVFSKAVIEHLYIHQIEHFMQELLRIAKPGAPIVLLTPDWRFLYRDFYEEFTHVTPFTQRSLQQCMQMYGIDSVSVESFIQLPFVWRYPWLTFLCDIFNFLPLPRSTCKLVRWSKDRVLLGIGRKP